MARESDDGVSFDPKSWGSTSTVPHGHPSSTSFDPKSWAAAETPPAPPPSAAGGTSPPPAAAGKHAGRGRNVLAVGWTASALLLLGGAATAYLARSPTAVVAASAEPASPVVAAPPVAAPVDASRRTLVIASAAELLATLTSLGLPADAAAAATAATAKALGSAPGDIRLVVDLAGPEAARKLTHLEATRDDGAGVTVSARADGSFTAESQQARLTTEVQVVRGEMDATSFYNAAVTAGVTDSLIAPFAKAFSYDFNFATDLHPGDIFEAAFEQKVNPQGERVGPPTLVYVSLQTEAKSKSLYRFLAPGDTEPGWFDGNGRSTVTALMRTPVDGARISSGFGMRFHPVLHFNKLHKGTDFAAPNGTTIYAAGTGVIEWAAMKGPNGNLTILRHDNGWQTYYLHQSMFMPGVVPGAHVSQGQKIGEIGTTGRSTGPHLHFELHVDGQPIDPMSVETGTGRVLGGDALAGFKKERDRIDVSRAAPTQ